MLKDIIEDQKKQGGEYGTVTVYCPYCHQGMAAAVENEENKKDTVAERTEILQPRGVGYALEEVRQIYDEQVTMIRQFERIRKFGDLSEDDELQYKRSKIIRDGMTYILDAFQEGTIC